MTWAIAELLAEHAGRVTVSNPMRTRAIASAKVKTDKIDAKVLAQLGAADFLPELWAPDELTRALRRRIAHRSSLVRQRTRLRNQIPRGPDAQPDRRARDRRVRPGWAAVAGRGRAAGA
jgi:transposase